jgi:hypothetical protein
MTAAIRLFRVTYKATYHMRQRRVAEIVVKVPYGGAFAMTELLTRMLTVGEIEWFRISLPTKAEIEIWRPRLQRWLPSLVETSELTGVDWTI